METRDTLKTEICNYLISNGVSRDLLPKCLAAIKDAAHQNYPLDREMLMEKHIREYAKALDLKTGDDFYVRLCWSFASRHYATLVGFVRRLEIILEAEYQAEMELEDAIEKEIMHQHDPLGDEYYDEMGCPDFAVCVYEDHIEVRAYCPGVGEKLPRNRKYIGCQGDIRWSFPLASLDELKRLNRPVVNVSDFQK